MTKKLSKIWLTLIAVFMILGLAMPSQAVSARGFSGGHTSFHSTYHATPTRSYHGTSSYHAPSRSTTRSYHTTRSYRAPKSYHVNRYPSSQYSTHRYDTHRRSSGIGSEFGHSIIRGAGWSIGANMGNSIWHQTFGFGGDRYVDDNGHVQYAKPGHSGWVLIMIILAIIAIVIAIHRANHRDDHHY